MERLKKVTVPQPRLRMPPAAFALVLATSIAMAGAADAKDLAGSRDPDYFKRYEGSEIVGYHTSPYDEYHLARGAGTPGGAGFEKSETVEGAITRIIYRVPEGHSALELLRNYENMISAAGFTQTYELAPCGNINFSGYFVDRFYYQNQPVTPNNPRPFSEATNECYFTAKATMNGQDLTVAVFVDESSGVTWRLGKAPAVTIKPGEILVGVDVIAAKSVQDKMVLVKAEDMANALNTTGKVDLYGILFDLDKSTIRPDSKAVLDEIAKLLKTNPAMKLEVSGHTDNSGTADHNIKLSQARARAVVDALVKQYGIAAARLTAAGYGDSRPVAPNDSEANRARNRRVELKKL